MNATALRSLRVQLAGSFLALAVVPVALVAVFATIYSQEDARDRAAERSSQVALAVGGEISRFLDAQVIQLTEVRLAAEHSTTAGEPVLGEHLAEHLEANPALRSILLVDRSGRVAHAFPPDPDVLGSDYGSQPYVVEALQRNGPTWSSATISPRTGQPMVTLVEPGVRWTVIGFLDLASLAQIAARSRLGHGSVAVLDRDGTLIAHPDARLVQEHTNLAAVPLVRRALAGDERSEEIDLLGQRQLASAAQVPLTGWAVLVAEPVAQAYAGVARARNQFLMVFAAAAAAAVVAGLLSARRLLRPLQALGIRARALAAGEPQPPPPAPAPAPVASFMEVEALGRSFDAMADAVRARELALERSERGFRRLVSTSLVGVARTTPAGEILFANEALAGLLGAPSARALVGRDMTDFYQDPAQRAELLTQLGSSDMVANKEVVLGGPGSPPHSCLINVARDEGTLTAVVVDITDLKRAAADRERLESQLHHSQRVEAVGRLAGGVAHDLNNVLTAILGFAELVRESLPPGHLELGSVDGIIDAANRAASLTRSLLAFSRKQVLQPRPIDVREVVQGVAAMLRRLLDEDVELVLELADAPLVAVVDPGRLEQVLVNLATNARDAMPGGGRLTIAADRCSLSPEEAQAAGLERGGRHVRLAVRDTGTGMSDETQRQVFEPFFTTKAMGKGTGLGLSIVHGIVRQHEGQVSLASAPGRGTVVTVLLPADEGPAEPLERRPVGPAPGGQETILVADDEPGVRRVVKAILERAGYRVLEAADGEEAVERFRAHSAEVALCVLDVVMPRLNGREALERIRAVRPGVRVLLASGYTGDVLERRGVVEGAIGFVAKPVSPRDLLVEVRRALDAPWPAV